MYCVAGMAHHRKPEEEDTSSPVEEAKEVMSDHGSSTWSAQEKSRPLSSSATSCLLPARSLRSTTAIPVDAQAQSQLANDEERASIRSLSFSKLLSFRLLPSSLFTLGNIIDHQHDADDVAASNSSIMTREEDKEEKLKQICRSQSVPTTSVRRFNIKKAAGGLRRVGPAGFRVVVVHVSDIGDDGTEGEGANKERAAAAEQEEEEKEDDIAVEEAVCRICMVALPDTDVLKLECCCKGELALAHRACAIKWFSIKGNAACDVCGQEVLNLPVTLLHLHSHHPSSSSNHQVTTQQQQQQQQEAALTTTTSSSSSSSRRYRVWHGTPILVIISMLAYFCFLEQLLVGDHGTAALAISLPFACVLGLFSSLTTTKMVSRRYVWIYSAVQFLFIVLFTNLFYRYVRMQAVIAIILSTFAGFSVAICTNSVLLQIVRWRVRRVASPTVTEGQEEHRETPMVDLEIAHPLP